jgi:uncharacterized membrane protein
LKLLLGRLVLIAFLLLAIFIGWRGAWPAQPGMQL